jgi:type VI secretion system protein ImpK
MSGPGSGDMDQPTVTRRLSPRLRTGISDSDIAADRASDFGDEPTVIVRRQPEAAEAVPPAGPESLQAAMLFVQQLEATRERTLVRAAAPLLLLMAELRGAIDRADVAGLRRTIMDEIGRFQQLAQKSGAEAGDIVAARYVLCSAIDETMLMTPWGGRSDWRAESLLKQYHNEDWGGEKVFLILDRVKAGGERKLQLLVLIHACLMLGFEGRYRVIKQGRDQLDELRNEISRLVRRHSLIDPDEPLCAEIRPVRERRRRSLPLWVVSAGGAVVLLAIFVYAQLALSGAVQPVVAAMTSLGSG